MLVGENYSAIVTEGQRARVCTHPRAKFPENLLDMNVKHALLYACQACLTMETEMDQSTKRYYKEFGGSMGAYAVMVPISVWLLKGHEHTVLGYGIALLPIIPSAFALWAFMRFFRDLDELQRKINLEAVAFSFLATCLITLTWAFLQNAGLPRFDVSWVAPLLIMLWGVGQCMARRRYQ